MDWESHSLLYPLLLNKNIEFGVLYFRVVIAIIDSHGKIKEVLFLYFVGFWLLVVGPIFSDGGGHDPLDHPLNPPLLFGLKFFCLPVAFLSERRYIPPLNSLVVPCSEEGMGSADLFHMFFVTDVENIFCSVEVSVTNFPNGLFSTEISYLP